MAQQAQQLAQQLAQQSARQLDLPFERESRRSVPAYKAWARKGMTLPYEPGRREHAIGLWLRNLAESLRDAQDDKREA